MIEIPRPLAAALGAMQPSRDPWAYSGPLWPYFLVIVGFLFIGLVGCDVARCDPAGIEGVICPKGETTVAARK